MYKLCMYMSKKPKQYLAIAFLAATFPAMLSAQQTHLDIKAPARMGAEVVGPVKSVETDLCKNVSDEHTRKRIEYDETGNTLTIVNWDSDDKLADTTTNFYDENGCFYRQQYIGFGKKGLTNDWEVVLNPETRQIAMKNKRTGSIIVRTYSPEKQLMHYRFMDKEKKQKSASRNTWNANNQRTEYVKYDERNRPLYTYWFKWKDNGFIDKERQRYQQEKKERLHDYEYLAVDDHGNWTQQLMVRYDIGGGEKEKVYERTTVRKIEYFEEEAANEAL
jgi:hypothetical protein